MMTTVHRRRKTRRFRKMRGSTSYPPTWLPPPREATPEAGSATPGRGGRRKRRRHQAALRARVRHLMSVARGLPTLRPRMLEMWSRHAFYWCRPETLGRRERRRRAKLRRRRARRRSGWTTIPTSPGLWRALAASHLLRKAQERDAQRLLRM